MVYIIQITELSQKCRHRLTANSGIGRNDFIAKMIVLWVVTMYISFLLNIIALWNLYSAQTILMVWRYQSLIFFSKRQ